MIKKRLEKGKNMKKIKTRKKRQEEERKKESKRNNHGILDGCNNSYINKWTIIKKIRIFFPFCSIERRTPTRTHVYVHIRIQQFSYLFTRLYTPYASKMTSKTCFYCSSSYYPIIFNFSSIPIFIFFFSSPSSVTFSPFPTLKKLPPL